ncbi:MAG TPA: hypothetical protein VH371_04410 [Candidatus Limnocylindrales bacterium]|jgi:hypothetical protein
MTDNDAIAWRAVTYGTPVLTNDGTMVGTVHEMLGADEEDIFHGVRLAASNHHDVMIPASEIAAMTRSAVTTSMSAAEVADLPAYDETATYHLASVGWLRKHLGWKQDSKSDEEPG